VQAKLKTDFGVISMISTITLKKNWHILTIKALDDMIFDFYRSL
jgi:hypothetical protein